MFEFPMGINLWLQQVAALLLLANMPGVHVAEKCNKQ